MKNYYLSIPLYFFLCSCHKTTPVNTVFSYSVSKIQNDTIVAGTIADLLLQVDPLDGYPDSVTLRITGLPANITMKPSIYSHLPPFREDFIFTANDSAAPGVYPITVTASCPSLADKVFTFDMTVTPADCSVKLVDTANAYDTCNIGNYYYPVTVSEGNAPYQVSIEGLGGSTASVFADVNCPANTFSISRQNISGNLSIQGTGTFTATKIMINYSVFDVANPTVTCSLTISR